MSQPVQVTGAVLAAAAPVTTLVADRISPIIGAQKIVAPFVTMQALSTDPVNYLGGFDNLDQCRVIVTAWATTYDEAMSIANACRTAMEAAGHHCESRSADQFDPDPDPGLYHVEHQFVLWL